MDGERYAGTIDRFFASVKASGCAQRSAWERCKKKRSSISEPDRPCNHFVCQAGREMISCVAGSADRIILNGASKPLRKSRGICSRAISRKGHDAIAI